MRKFAFLILLSALSGCEGIKILTIKNESKSDIRITVKPCLNKIEIQSVSNYQYNQNIDSTVIIIMPDSSMILLSKFGPLLFNKKISERDLITEYVKIESDNETIVADSKKKIIELIKENTSKNQNLNYATKETSDKNNINRIYIWK